MSKIQELKALLEQYGLWAKKRLGQNFLVDEEIFEHILGAADLKSTDNIIEVGPGTGFLTEQLIEKAHRLIAVEYDSDMIRVLEQRFRKSKNLELVYSDILKFRIKEQGFKGKPYKVVANIPYYITSPLLKLFLQSECKPSLMVVLVQREVAEKICGLSSKSVITIETQLYGKPEIIGIVPRDAFYPVPAVDSAILKIEVFKKPLMPESQMADFIRLVKFGFSQKRKKLSNTLSAGLRFDTTTMKTILLKADIDPNLRAENLEIEDWKRLLKVLTKLKK
ncbi:ribosomal RNA small subunit methyltransferase A [Candidatus Peregrinibacteria bacterium]|nr:ribosomal RNA small subunit methyltransferase A [Candidatus Peregrinibacteria bacterium]